jgi:hypothetical protein
MGILGNRQDKELVKVLKENQQFMALQCQWTELIFVELDRIARVCEGLPKRDLRGEDIRQMILRLKGGVQPT